jgi:hypothetical protein
MIIARSKIKFQFITELARNKYKPFFADLGYKMEFWENLDNETTIRQELIRNVGLSLRNFGKANTGMYSNFLILEYAGLIRDILYLITKPSISLVRRRLLYCDSISKLTSNLLEISSFEVYIVSQFILDTLNSIGGLRQSLLLFNNASSDYLASLGDSANIGRLKKDLEDQVRKHGSASTIRKFQDSQKYMDVIDKRLNDQAVLLHRHLVNYGLFLGWDG